jgi:hypothetical protein
MSSRKLSTLSPRRITANRQNSQKSTGPRTGEGKQRVALNALKHGCYAQPDNRLRDYLVKLGFDPSELERLHQDLIEAWRPAGITEGLLVRDLANLYSDKIRLQRGRVAQQLNLASQSAREREYRRLRKAREERSLPDYEISTVGYRGAPGCDEKFEESLRLLGLLQDHAARREWSQKTKECLTLLYAEFPSRVGKQIIDLVELFASSKPTAPADEAAYNQLTTLLEKETSLVTREFELFREEQAKKDDAYSDEGALAQARHQLLLASDWDKALDRQIETKVKLLLRLKAARLESPVQQPGGADSIGPEITPDKGEAA